MDRVHNDLAGSPLAGRVHPAAMEGIQFPDDLPIIRPGVDKEAIVLLHGLQCPPDEGQRNPVAGVRQLVGRKVAHQLATVAVAHVHL